MALFQKTVTQKRRDSDYNETLLLNSKRLVDYHPDNDGKIIFYYAEVYDRKVYPIEYHADESFDTFITHVRDEEVKEQDTGLVQISLTAETKGPNDEAFAKKIGFHQDNFIKAVEDPNDANKSYVYLAYGAFGPVRYKVDATLSDIESEASASISA